MPLLVTALIFAFLGAILSAVVKTLFTGENKTPTPEPNPTVVRYLYDNRKKRLIGGFIVVIFIMRMFGPQFHDATLLIGFSFSTGLMNYLLTEWVVNFAKSTLTRILPGFKNGNNNGGGI